MAMNLMLSLAALVDEGELEEGSNVGTVASEGDEGRNIGGVVVGILAVGVEVDGPLVPTHGEALADDVLSHAHAFGQRVSPDLEPVGAVDGLRHRSRARRRQERVPAPVLVLVRVRVEAHQVRHFLAPEIPNRFFPENMSKLPDRNCASASLPPSLS